MVFLASLSQENLLSLNHAHLGFVGDLVNDTAGTQNSGNCYENLNFEDVAVSDIDSEATPRSPV